MDTQVTEKGSPPYTLNWTTPPSSVSKRRPGMPMVVVGIPAYNEERSIAKVIVLSMKHADKVIVLDDGSVDTTAEIARSLGATVISHEENRGKGEALRSLFIEAQRDRPDILVTIDGDGQHDPQQIPSLVEAVSEGADVVVGSRYLGDIPHMRRLGNRVLNSASGAGVADTQSGFRAYRGTHLDDLLPTEMGMGADAEILRRARERDMKIVEVPISVAYEDNTPTHNPFYHGVDVLLSTIKQLSIRHPLMFYGIPGFASTVVALFFWGWTLEAFSEHRTLITNLALVAAATTLVGLILLAIAVILWVMISVVREGRP